MYTKIDWLSFTLVIGLDSDGQALSVTERTAAELARMSENLYDILFSDGETEAGQGRAPYNFSIVSENGGVRFYGHPKLPHVLFEISGRGCDAISERGDMPLLLHIIQQRLTRIDVACDIECKTSPTAFAEMRDAKRFKSHAHMLSDSGETYYVGSRTSARYARVYRYNEPHERAKYLRCEMVVKADDARIAAFEILTDGLETYAAKLGNVFGWTHSDWSPDVQTTMVPTAYRQERHEGKTIYWLTKTVAPLLRRLQDDGVLDVERWFKENVTDPQEE